MNYWMYHELTVRWKSILVTPLSCFVTDRGEQKPALLNPIAYLTIKFDG